MQGQVNLLIKHVIVQDQDGNNNNKTVIYEKIFIIFWISQLDLNSVTV